MTASGSTWWKRALPAVAWLRGYQRSWFRLDFAAGITLAAYLLPAALGDASLANLPAARSWSLRLLVRQLGLLNLLRLTIHRCFRHIRDQVLARTGRRPNS